MNENVFKFEKRVEKNPNERELFNKLEEILEVREYKELARVEDEEGLKSLDIQTNDENGDRVDILYERHKVLRDGSQVPAKIIETLYDGEIPSSVGSQYNYVNGEWKGPF